MFEVCRHPHVLIPSFFVWKGINASRELGPALAVWITGHKKDTTQHLCCSVRGHVLASPQLVCTSCLRLELPSLPTVCHVDI